ncbi:hypothetical protein PV755_24785 [Streptomyces caniscabiei]|uniref:Secreted protein n=1 Tax=Streptomyces caniscabiei TaxID=2746961 RepID=A0A927KZV2_9ACTN|nr:hypothetical protein [Streptomyces caniscabiei]MBD9723421.1 hypothetical protein [Streptomyces caniscabiei]MDX3512102.1 hypothetical protein [Streptomyces caniscabiei]MDX3718844.1 hypothetical protein [Streptomyces caniscabiei]WEO26993.1 hypothetical protein IHE65_29690 [Streptomyces caniscabiei]
MEAVIAVVALFFVLLVVLGAYATVKAVGAAKRGVDRTITQAKRTVEDTTLRARSLAQPGPVGQLADLRLKLRTSMRATQEALHAGVGEDESLKESLALFDQLSKHGKELDAELRRLEPEPDRAKVAQRLPALRERTERIIKSADSLRWAAHDRARKFAEDDLDTLSAQIDVEAGALRHWTTEPADVWPEAPRPEPAASTGQTWQETPGSGGAGAGEGASRGAGAAEGASRSGESSGGQEPPRPAITPPSARPTYPWQKKPRPESTT